MNNLLLAALPVAALPVPKVSFLIFCLFLVWLIILLILIMFLKTLGYKSCKKVIIGSIIELIIGMGILGSLSFYLTLIIIHNNSINLWTTDNIVFFIVGMVLLFPLNFLIAKYLFNFKIKRCILFAILISILINPVWFSSIIDLAKEIYPGTWYNIRNEGFPLPPYE